jgi:hypothetical protein
MRIVKGISLGLAIFVVCVVVGSVVYSYVVNPGAQATGTTALVALTIYNWIFWAAFVASLAIGLMIARRSPKVQH